MSTTLSILGPLLGFFGLFIGAMLTRNREQAKYRKDRTTEVYADFVKVTTDSSSPRASSIAQKQFRGQPLTAEELAFFDEQHRNMNNARVKLLIYGSRRVIEALSHFYDVSGPGADPQVSMTALVKLITAMRDDSEAESYPAFAAHVDNVVGLGPDRRLLAFQAQFAQAAPQ